jgi:hypothetical protein
MARSRRIPCSVWGWMAIVAAGLGLLIVFGQPELSRAQSIGAIKCCPTTCNQRVEAAIQNCKWGIDLYCPSFACFAPGEADQCCEERSREYAGCEQKRGEFSLLYDCGACQMRYCGGSVGWPVHGGIFDYFVPDCFGSDSILLCLFEGQ